MDNISYITGILRLGKYSNGKERIYKILIDPSDDDSLVLVYIDPEDGEEKIVTVDISNGDLI